MRYSAKSSTAIHCLLMIASLSSKQKITSNILASSVGCHPVEIRKCLSKLTRAGIIEVKRGLGGAYLKRSPNEISVFDIYKAVESKPSLKWIKIHEKPQAQCPFGKHINPLLTHIYTKITKAVIKEMSSIHLEDILCEMKKLEPTLF